MHISQSITLLFLTLSNFLTAALLNHHPQNRASEDIHQQLDAAASAGANNGHSPSCDGNKGVVCTKFPCFEVKVLLSDCPNEQCANPDNKTMQLNHVKGNQALDSLLDCTQKLLLYIRLINMGPPNDKSEYIIIDHITDPVTGKKVRILNPYAVRIRQEPMTQLYALNYERTVNAEAREKVYNKHNLNYRGCDTGLETPTCGIVKHNGQVVPYSTGFCCSCNSDKNRWMEALDEKGQWPQSQSHRNTDDPNNNNNGRMHPLLQNYYSNRNEFITSSGGGGVYGTAGLMNADNGKDGGDSAILKESSKVGADSPVLRQRRGGQNCADIDLDSLPESFFESTHCLTFSSMWYQIYSIQRPRIYHKLKVQVYQKFEDCHGKTHWLDMTKGRIVELGTEKASCGEHDASIIAKYRSDPVRECDQAINHKTHKILVAEKRVSNPAQFLVIPKKVISPDGKSCNKAGVGYEGFYKQKKRCAVPKGSCLANQPLHFHRRDIESEKGGQKGKYFIKYYGTLTSHDPVTYNVSGEVQSIKMMYTKRHVSNLYFEINADLMTLLEPNALATITEVYSDATDPKKTRIVVKITNSGLLYGIYYVRMTRCPLEVPASFNNIASKSVLITPQHQHIFNMYIEYPLNVNSFYCSIHVHNLNQELIAVRKVRIQTGDRCICIWYCDCVCYEADGGLKCHKMSLRRYHAAGFQGGFPMATHLVENSYLDEMLGMLLHMFIVLILTLLVMGLLKALLGLCSQVTSLWGLDTILGTENTAGTCGSKECDYQQEGVSMPAQFCLNLIFFFIYPLALMNICIKRTCFSGFTGDRCTCEDRWDDYDCQGPESCRKMRAKRSKTKTSSEDRTKSSFSMKYTSSDDKDT